jgi:hypothetical protein
VRQRGLPGVRSPDKDDLRRVHANSNVDRLDQKDVTDSVAFSDNR